MFYFSSKVNAWVLVSVISCVICIVSIIIYSKKNYFIMLIHSPRVVHNYFIATSLEVGSFLLSNKRRYAQIYSAMILNHHRIIAANVSTRTFSE